jgi:hypothetical protein
MLAGKGLILVKVEEIYITVYPDKFKLPKLSILQAYLHVAYDSHNSGSFMIMSEQIIY